MIIAVDFDGTVIENGYWPEIGPEIPGAIHSLIYLHQMGHKIIINSCREGQAEQKLKNWIKSVGIPADAVNENLPERLDEYGTDCRKISADIYIDDRAIFCRRICWPDIVREIDKLDDEVRHRRQRK